MFSKNIYMFPNVSSSAIVDLNGVDLSIHHDVLAGHFLASNTANAPVVVEAATNSDNPMFDQGGGDPTARKLAPPAKRDRHSKIYTSQGPRDRRVRLSIGIARKFFDLQELLGFDKPSKTLDWLLTKSKTAIKDLVLQTEQINAAKNPSSPSEVQSSGNFDAFECENYNSEKGKSVSNRNKSSGKDPQQIAAMNLAKESRVKARARARERTREKMCIKQMNETRNTAHESNQTIIPIQYMNNQLNDFCKISGSSSSSSSSMKMNPGILHFPPNLGTESILIKRKMKNHPPIWGFQQNLGNSSPNSLPFPYYNNSTENWDYSSIPSSQPNFYAILDQQHIFINSSSTSNN